MMGKALGHYRVGEQLGRGGMGEVYVADDLNLDRKVALKFPPDAFAGDAERMARFEREAKLLASLNHPNIAAIHGLEQAEVSVDVRSLAANHRDLEDLVRKGQFRQDLYHRVYVFPLILPPLRDRMEDIPILIEHFSSQIAGQNSWKKKPFTPEAIEELKRYSWPGNIRELRNVVERLLLLADDAVDQQAVKLSLPLSDKAPSAIMSTGGILAER